MTVEITRADTWVYQQLSGDATLNAAVSGRIYQDSRPQGSALPAVVYSTVSPGVDLFGIGDLRVWVNAVYIVKVIGQGRSYAPISAIADRIDAVLHRESGNIGDAAVIRCYREGVVRYAEIEDDNEYRHLGGRFRVLVK